MMSSSIYESLFDSSPIAHLVISSGGKIKLVNKTACNLFGYSQIEIQLHEKDTIFDNSDNLFTNWMQQQNDSRHFNGMITGKRKDGNLFPLHISSNFIIDENGESLINVTLQALPDHFQDSINLSNIKVDNGALIANALDNITDGFYIVDKNWTILFWNRAAEKMLLRKREELIGKNLWEEFPGFQFLKNNQKFEILTKENKSIHFREYSPVFKIWVDITAYPTATTFSFYFKDVTEVINLRVLEKLERNVLEMNAKPDSTLAQTLKYYLKELQELHPGMICSVLQLKGNRLYNWSSPNLSANYCKAIDGLEIGDNMCSCGTAAFLKEKVIVSDIENDLRWINFKELAQREGVKACWSFPIMDSLNRVMGTFAIYYKKIKKPSKEEENTLNRAKNLLMIILENKIAVEEVKSSNQSYDMVAKATNDAIWDWDVSTNEVIRTGNGLQVLFGYAIEDFPSSIESWDEKIQHEDFSRVAQKRDLILQDPSQLYWEDEYRFQKKDGNYSFVYDKAYIIRDYNGKAQRLIGATRDITERKKNELLLQELNTRLKQRADELAASNVELERFAYIASHDMQEPLRMVTSFLQLFKKKYENQLDETAEQYIHFAMDGAERMKKLIMDLLEYSRVGSNKDDFSQINTNELLLEVVNVFIDKIQESNAKIEIDSLPNIYANRTQLFQLFQNLIGNALKYHNGQHIHIQIKGEEKETHYLFSVSDNGIGIKPIFFEKVFILFQRLHHKNEYSGTGIGLAICKKIIDRHNGKIWVDSEPDKGSSFYFTISKNMNRLY